MNRGNVIHGLLAMVLTLLLAGCAMMPPEPSSGHLKHEPGKHAEAPIPRPVQQVPVLPPPREAPQDDVYTVVVNGVPVGELLFALARDAGLNVDVYPGIEGEVTLNAIDQTLPQILDRIADQVDIRYELKGTTLVVSPDTPYARTYKVDYLYMDRVSRGEVSIATQISSAGASGGSSEGEGGGGSESVAANNSTTAILNLTQHRFWYSLILNIAAIIGDEGLIDAMTESSDEEQGGSGGDQGMARLGISQRVIPHPEAGLITVVATRRQHERIRELMERVQESTQRQVLIEATVVEVELSYDYQTGVDWSRIAKTEGFTLMQNMIGNNLSSAPYFLLNYTNPDSSLGNITASIRMLEQFGDVKILSSPKAMVLNNQTALLKVVDNRVYFTVDVDSSISNGLQNTTFETTIHTVPVGFVMSVTPQISEADTVIMNVRPTVSRIVGYVNDPNPALALAGVESRIPEIQVREIESILRVHSGQMAVLGGLMQDSYDRGRSGLPGLTRTSIADFFGTREDKHGKTELVIFLRPTVIRNASLDEDLKSFSKYMEGALDVGRKIP